jgi:phage-related protein
VAITAAQLVAKVSAEGVDQAKSQISGMGEATERASGGLKGMLSNALSMAAGFAIFTAGAAAVGFLTDQITSTIKAGMDQQAILKQTETVIKSTGDASGMSAKQIGAYADKMADLTPISDDLIQSSENILLTFTNIGKNVFPQAESSILDVSTAMHEDLQSATVQVGKALNDPVKGMTALQRIGVTFTDSQKEAVKQMVATGNQAGAQAIILKELQKEFGGSAEAAGKTFGGQLSIAGNELDQVKEKIGMAVLPALASLATSVLSGAMPALQHFGDWLTATAVPALDKFGLFIASNVVPILGKLGGFITGTVVPDAMQLASFFEGHILPILITLGTIILTKVVPTLASIGQTIFTQLLPPLERLWNNISPILIPALQFLGNILSHVVGPALNIVITIVGKLVDAINAIISAIQAVIGWFQNMGNAASQAFNSVKQGVNNIPVLGGIANWAGFAEGTDSVPHSGVYTVGERGPEEVWLPQGARVIPNNQLATRGTPVQGGGGNGPIYMQLDGRTFATVFMPYIANAIRYNVGTHA